ncbi:hypothetical protein BpsS36_00044 [Bacillus phage vB_BpsS-36]|uniref:Uncharacterized protein n=1 Tax=Bacillus phage vB_BpsS-36 TaxID=2419622 RepID=A0A3G3BX47_9CAUD|nr:hypothetical protein BpsS36_00044 [Bacillus phage vB_BpsS-36]
MILAVWEAIKIIFMIWVLILGAPVIYGELKYAYEEWKK